MAVLLFLAASVAVIAIGYLGASRHRMAGDVDGVTAAWHQVDRNLRLRADLVPDLVEMVRAHATHERFVFGHVHRAHQAALEARRGSQQVREHPEAALGLAMESLLRVADAHPSLAQDERFLTASGQYATASARLADAYLVYNRQVKALNRDVAAAPAVAGWLGIGPARLAEVPVSGRGRLVAAA